MDTNFSGTWRNDNGSEMDLSVGDAGALTGAYRTAVGRPGGAEEFALTGFANGDLVVFCVNFGEYGTLTSWTGKLCVDANGDSTINTLWHLARSANDSEQPLAMWETILAGSSTYRRP